MLLSLQDKFNLSSAFIQVSWITISLVGIIRFYFLTSRSRFSAEEQSFLAATMPGLGAIDARRLLDLGAWHTQEPGFQLTEQGEENISLYYLLDGSVYVQVDNHVIARLEGKSFIGEMTLVTGAPASATVVLGETSRYLELPVEPLRRLMERNTDIRQHLKASMSGRVLDAGNQLDRRSSTYESLYARFRWATLITVTINASSITS